MIGKIKEEIQRQLQESKERLNHIKARGWVAPNEEQLIVHLKSLLSFINTLEVKEGQVEKENKIEILADIIFNAAKYGYMPYNTQDEYCAMEIAKKNIDKLIT